MKLLRVGEVGHEKIAALDKTNVIRDISDQIETKLDALRLYKSQIDESEGPRSVEAVRALAKFRGSQAGFSYGEAFYLIRQTY